MHHQVRGLLYIVLAFCLYSCNSDEPKVKEQKRYAAGDRQGTDSAALEDVKLSRNSARLICQRWDNSDDYDAAKYIPANSKDKSLEMPMRGFYFFKDGQVVKNPRDKMEFGTWVYDAAAKTLAITLQSGTKENYKVSDLTYEHALFQKQGEEKAIAYVADGFIARNLADDPFYPANMQWRVKPAAAEDNVAIHKRIKDCLHFYYLFYTDNSKRNLPAILFYGLPGCFKWYAGGILLKNEKELDNSWFNIFYNKSDADAAYTILDKMISKKYTWDKEAPGWVKQNAGVLKQMEAKIDSL